MITHISAISSISIKEPILLLGKHFRGDYQNSQRYVTEVQNLLSAEEIEFVPFKVLGIFYDNPRDKNADELRSFHAVFAVDGNSAEKTSLERFILKGDFLSVKVVGDPSKAILEGYGSLFDYIGTKSIKLKSNAGFQISSFENGQITTEILMELSNELEIK